jgi:thiol-disulfide isomerase/thioredoxin
MTVWPSLVMTAAAGVLVASCTGAPKEAGQPTQSAPDAKPLAIGDTMPSLRAVTIAGDSAVIGGPNPAITLVNVWATWCTSCREEMADLEAIYKESAPKGLRVIAVSVDAGSEDLVKRYVEHEKLTFPVVHDQDGRVQAHYQIMGIPATYLVGKDGRLLWQRTGGIHGATGEARAAVAAALK